MTYIDEVPPQIKNIKAKDQNEAKYLSINCISEIASYKFYQINNYLPSKKGERIPHSKLPTKIYQVIGIIIDNKMDLFEQSLTKQQQVLLLSKLCPAKD